jgi:RHH-type rel operon transcriptional repressor/antitoxin RelB
MLTVRLSDAMEARLDRLSKKTGRSKSYYVKKAIEEYVEDREDYLLAIARLEDNEPPIPLKEVKRRLGLED